MTAFGHKTRPDGTLVPMTPEEAQSLLDEVNRQSELEAELLPDTASVLSMRVAISNRLRKLGWSCGIYCPKDGETFAAIAPGCSAILPAHYEGLWPRGELWIFDDTYDPKSVWWKALSDLTAAEREKMERSTGFNMECVEGEFERYRWMADEAGD